jgi:hypothetical protein
VLAALQVVMAAAGDGAGGLRWYGPDGLAPLWTEENGVDVFLLAQGTTDVLSATIVVPPDYIAGKPVSLLLPWYSPSAANNVLWRATSYLVRENSDAVGSTTNSYTSTNAAVTNTLANMYRKTSIDLTDSTGKINSVSVAPGSIIRASLTRGTDTDTAEARVFRQGATPKFG